MGLSVSRKVAAPAPVAWQLLTQVEAWPSWGPTVSGAHISSGGTVPGVIGSGARGTVRTAVGVSLPFVITRFDEGRMWAWSVAGVPATSHTVRPIDGGCIVSFGVPWWAPGYLPVCALALLQIERVALDGSS